MSEPWVSVADVPRRLGVAKYTIYRRIEGRVMPAHRVGRLRKFKLSEAKGSIRALRADVSVAPKSRGAK